MTLPAAAENKTSGDFVYNLPIDPLDVIGYRQSMAHWTGSLIAIALIFTLAGCGGTVEFRSAQYGQDGGNTDDVVANMDTDPDMPLDAGVDVPDNDTTGYNYEGNLLFEPWVNTIWPLSQRCALDNCHGNNPGPGAQGFRLNPNPEDLGDHALNLGEVEPFAAFVESPERSAFVRLGTNDHSGTPWNETETCTVVGWLYNSNDQEPPPCP